MPRVRTGRIAAATLAFLLLSMISYANEALSVRLQWQRETSPDGESFQHATRQESWKPSETAIIVCDVWDSHHSINAVRRLGEFAPRLDAVLKKARASGVTVIHSPSDCMAAYAGHPARERATATPRGVRLPHDIEHWCSGMPSEKDVVYPIDQSDGGDDDDPAEHAEWAKKLVELGRNPNLPWQRQSDLITIDSQRDYLTDKGDEVWSILENRGIRNVILTGVHVNMCVLGRPFGLRQMARNGKNVVLMRDMTDAMYNPRRWPYVSHFTGNDFIIDHIERHVCPTITSDQFLGGAPFRFSQDTRPHVVCLIAEEGYGTDESLPRFARESLGQDFRVTILHGNGSSPGSIPGLSILNTADLLLVSVRRHPLPPVEMAILRDFVRRGKPVVGIRTASHAFSLANGATLPAGLEDWPSFDKDVFGGHYHGGYPDDLLASLSFPESIKKMDRLTSKEATESGASILNYVGVDPLFEYRRHLYKTSPLEPGATVLLEGTVKGEAAEPVAWTFRRLDGGRSFYVSLGAPRDFNFRSFRVLLRDGVSWAAGLPDRPRPGNWSDDVTWDTDDVDQSRWVNVSIPILDDRPSRKIAEFLPSPQWFRCVVRIPGDWVGTKPVRLEVGASVDAGEVTGYLNGSELKSAGSFHLGLPPEAINRDDHNLLVLRFKDPVYAQHISPVLRPSPDAGDPQRELDLAGPWQIRSGRDDTFCGIPLPAKFAFGGDLVVAPEDPLWVARPLTRIGEFTAGIEGPACDRAGNVYAVNFAREGTIGRVTPDGKGEVFVDLPKGSVGNGIVFGKAGEMFVADYTGHNILRIDPASKKVTVHAHNDGMSQPNDIAIAADVTLYASDPNWKESTGQIWRIDPDGKTTRLAAGLGTVNGIEVSPDGKTLYCNESVQRNIWAFPINDDKTLGEKRLVRKFEDHGFDGMRADVDGNLYVTRHGKGTVVKLSPAGEILREIDVLGKSPSNLCFGGPDGRTVYVTEVESTRLVRFRVDRPGRSHAFGAPSE